MATLIEHRPTKDRTRSMREKLSDIVLYLLLGAMILFFLCGIVFFIHGVANGQIDTATANRLARQGYSVLPQEPLSPVEDEAWSPFDNINPNIAPTDTITFTVPVNFIYPFRATWVETTFVIDASGWADKGDSTPIYVYGGISKGILSIDTITHIIHLHPAPQPPKIVTPNTHSLAPLKSIWAETSWSDSTISRKIVRIDTIFKTTWVETTYDTSYGNKVNIGGRELASIFTTLDTVTRIIHLHPTPQPLAPTTTPDTHGLTAQQYFHLRKSENTFKKALEQVGWDLGRWVEYKKGGVK